MDSTLQQDLGLTDDQVWEIREIFIDFDEDRNGTISMSELAKVNILHHWF